jgi:hypothetical protein
MAVDRRRFLQTAGLSVAAGALAPPVGAGGRWQSPSPAGGDAGLGMGASPVRRIAGVEALRDVLYRVPPAAGARGHRGSARGDRPQPVRGRRARSLPQARRGAAWRRPSTSGGARRNVALVRSTTEGLALVYSGLAVRAGRRSSSPVHDHYVHHESGAPGRAPLGRHAAQDRPLRSGPRRARGRDRGAAPPGDPARHALRGRHLGPFFDRGEAARAAHGGGRGRGEPLAAGR